MAYHLWAGNKEFGKDSKKCPQDKTSPQARPINTLNAWDLDFMNKNRLATSSAKAGNVEEDGE
jgi:hypothetical protein